MFARVDSIEARSKHGDRRAAVLEASVVSRGVYTPGEAAHDHHTALGQLSRPARRPTCERVRRRRTRADDRDSRSFERLAGQPAVQRTGGRSVGAGEEGRISRIEPVAPGSSRGPEPPPSASEAAAIADRARAHRACGGRNLQGIEQKTESDVGLRVAQGGEDEQRPSAGRPTASRSRPRSGDPWRFLALAGDPDGRRAGPPLQTQPCDPTSLSSL